jgi:hypothetical protein
MESRYVLKLLREFARREMREKKADRVYIRRIKMEPKLRRGWLPDILVRGIKGVHYLVCVFSGDVMRVYYINKGGESLGASDFTGLEKDKIWSNVLERTRNILCLQQ